MDPVELRDFEIRIDEWLTQGYAIIADEIEGQIRLTVHYVPRSGEAESEPEQEFWPLVPELVGLLERNGIPVTRSIVGL